MEFLLIRSVNNGSFNVRYQMSGLRAGKVQLIKLLVGATEMISEIIVEALTITCNYMYQNYSDKNYKIVAGGHS